MSVPSNYYIPTAQMTYTGGNYGFAHSSGLWTDLFTAANGINPAGSPSPATASNVDGLLEFAGGSTDNVICGAWQMPHSWLQGGTVSPHVHVMAAAATNPSTGGLNKIALQFSYMLFQATGSEQPAAFTSPAQVNATLPNHGAGGRPVTRIIDLGDFAMTGYLHSACIVWQFRRVASDAVNDTYPDVMRLISCDLHYRHNKFGSVAEDGDSSEAPYL